MIYIMRHGKTDWNAAFRLQGGTDIPLNEEGRNMAKAARDRYQDLHFDICYCSPLIRAKETAEIFLEGSHTEIIVDERLREMGFGVFEGTEHVLEKEDCPIYSLFHTPEVYEACGGAESLEELYARTGDFIKDRLETEKAKNKTILVVGHGAMNCSVINQLENIAIADFWKRMHGNCELIKIEKGTNP